MSLKNLIILIVLVGASYQGWKYYQAHTIKPLYEQPYLLVYGRDSCGYTQETLQKLRAAKIKHQYLMVDDPTTADVLHGRMEAMGISTRNYLLPVVDLNNTISTRPDNRQLIEQAKSLSL
jgi:hypothetical protein